MINGVILPFSYIFLQTLLSIIIIIYKFLVMSVFYYEKKTFIISASLCLSVSLRKMKWDERGCRPLLCEDRLNCAGITTWGWWDDRDIHTQDCKFDYWRSDLRKLCKHFTNWEYIIISFFYWLRSWPEPIKCLTSRSNDLTIQVQIRCFSLCYIVYSILNVPLHTHTVICIIRYQIPHNLLFL